MLYEVIIPWHGVSKGQVVEIETLHPAFRANVKPIQDEVVDATDSEGGTLIPATPAATSEVVTKQPKKRGRAAKSADAE